MNTHRMSSGRRGHLQLVGPTSQSGAKRTTAPEEATPATGPTARERRTMTRVAASLRRRARRLPEDSPLRAELLETAEYYEAGAEQTFTTETTRPATAKAC
jgi:hypothetical protein